MEEKVFQAALAGLLHDIGKLLQRGRDDPWKLPEGYEREGQPVHALWSGYFIEHNVPKKYRSAALQGVYHHQPEKSPASDPFFSTLVAVADKLSAGERADEKQEERGTQLPQQMVSIFDRVGAYRENPHLAHHYLPLQSLQLDETALFPQPVMSAEQRRLAYEKLSQAMEAAAKEDIQDAETYLENLLAGLEQHTWCVPSAFYHALPDVSLYDHSRMTAALAVCLVERSPAQLQALLGALRASFSEKTSPEQKTLLDEPAALLVGGDISGIQKFIYTLSSKNAAKTLRGRSFYLQLLTEAVMRFVLRKLGLAQVNVIYSGGGHFYLLGPLSAAGQLPEIQRQVTQILLKHHGAALYLAIGAAEVPASGFKLGHFPQYWESMHAELARAKQQRYTELGDQLYPLVFQPQTHGGNREKTCAVCGEEKEDAQPLRVEEAEQGDRICGLCESFVTTLGKHLPQASYVVLKHGQPEEHPVASAQDVLAEFGLGLEMLDKNKKVLISEAQSLKAERAVVWALGDVDNWPKMDDLPFAKTLRYMVNRVPPFTFDELEKKSEQGIQRLGVLRMDVDDLGALLKNGFGEQEKSIATIARLSSLSFQLSLFFEGWVKKICEQTSADIYAVYSGGDDLFLIAPWQIVPKLAAKITSSFRTYTSENPSLHISGGMAFIHGKYPVYQAAEDAQDALSKAKDRSGKNAFHFLGQTWSWDEFAELDNKFTLLVRADQDHQAPASLLQVLQKLAIMDEENQSLGVKRLLWGKWLWLGDYQLKRMIEMAKTNQKLAADLEEIYADLSPNYYANIGMWGKAARWAQLYLRKSIGSKSSDPSSR